MRLEINQIWQNCYEVRNRNLAENLVPFLIKVNKFMNQNLDLVEIS